jgi:hypothetical protein
MTTTSLTVAVLRVAWVALLVLVPGKGRRTTWAGVWIDVVDGTAPC